MKIPYNVFGLDIAHDELVKISQQEYTIQEEHGDNIAGVLNMLNSGLAISSADSQKVTNCVAEMGITIDEALALNILSETSHFVREYMLTGDVQESAKQIYRDLQQKLQARAIPYETVRRVNKLLTQLDYTRPLAALINDSWDKISPRVTDMTAKASICTAIKEMKMCLNTPETCSSIMAVLQRTVNKQARIVYRGDKKPPKGSVIQYNKMLSTSATMDASFAKYDAFNYKYILFVPEGVHCMDISRVSGYSDTEKEVLFPPCNIHILHQQPTINKTVVYGLIQNKQ